MPKKATVETVKSPTTDGAAPVEPPVQAAIDGGSAVKPRPRSGARTVKRGERGRFAGSPDGGAAAAIGGRTVNYLYVAGAVIGLAGLAWLLFKPAPVARTVRTVDPDGERPPRAVNPHLRAPNLTELPR